MKKVILSSVSLMFLLSCSTQDPVNNTIHVVNVHNSGGSPECFISHAGLTTKYTTSTVMAQVSDGDVITVLGQSYSIDNTYNYGAPNVNVIAEIAIFIDGIQVKSGVNHATYMVK